MIGLVVAAVLSSQSVHFAQPLRPPNGTYVYSMNDGAGRTVFKSTITVKSDRSTFSISERTKLPNGAFATTRTIWSSAALLPLSFEVHQGKVALHALITASSLRFVGVPVAFPRMNNTSYILPSVGLIANSMMLPYVVAAHPGESITLAEIQNNQTVLIKPQSGSRRSVDGAGDVAVVVTKDKRHGDSADEEKIVTWLNPKTGIMDGGRATPGDAKITLLRFTPAA